MFLEFQKGYDFILLKLFLFQYKNKYNVFKLKRKGGFINSETGDKKPS